MGIVGHSIPAGKIGQHVLFSEDTPIAPASELVVTIPLDNAHYTMGRMTFAIPNSVYYSSTRRNGATITFTTVLNDAIALSGGRTNYNVYGYNFTDRWMKGYTQALDSQLSGNYFNSIGGGQVFIKSCQIISSNVELTFRNNHGSQPSRVTINGECIVWREN